MSRHRNIRSMNYSDEYDGYDDVYGHSLDDDYCISPSDAAFIYNRDGSRESQKISAFFKSDEDIAEEDETADRVANLDDIEKAKLNSCIEKVKSVLGDSKTSEQELISLILKHDFEVEKVIDVILTSNRLTQENKPEPAKDKDLFKNTKIHIPKLFNDTKNNNMFSNKIDLPVPALFSENQSSSHSSLSSLVSSHLKIKPEIPKLFDNEPLKMDTENSSNLFSNIKHTSSISSLISNHLDNKPNSSSHSSLSSLVSNHLKNNREIPNFCDQNSLNFFETNKNNENSINNEWHIDLTSALCNSNSAPLFKSKIVDNGEFTPLFVDCSPQKTKKLPTDFCKIDISDILYINNILEKSVSDFGKIVTKKFLFCKPRFQVYEKRNKSKFDFCSPSPDDVILSHLRRK